MQGVRTAQALDGGDLLAVVHQGQGQAGIHTSAVDVNRTRAALPVIAPLLGSGEGDRFPQAIEQRCARVDATPMSLAIDVQRDGNGTGAMFCDSPGRRGGCEKGAAAQARPVVMVISRSLECLSRHGWPP